MRVGIGGCCFAPARIEAVRSLRGPGTGSWVCQPCLRDLI